MFRIFSNTVSTNQGCGSGIWNRKRLIFVEAEALWRKKPEANSEAFNFLRSRKRKHFS